MSSLTAHLKGGKQVLKELPVIEQLSPLVWRLLGGNPGSYTLNGTNTYLLGIGPARILFDTGAGTESYSDTLVEGMRQAGCQSLSQIIISHWHHDHLGGVAQVMSLNIGSKSVIPVRKYMPDKDPQNFGQGESAINPFVLWPKEKFEPIKDGELIVDAGVHLKMLFTPGHANDHVVAILQEENSMFTGDNVLGVGTAVFNDLHLYLQSLRLMHSQAPTRLYPGHGPVVENGCSMLLAYIDHRLKRVVGAVEKLAEDPSEASGKWTLETLTRAIYVDLSEHLIPPAMSNTLQVLESLRKDNIVAAVGNSDESMSKRDDEWQLLISREKALRKINNNNIMHIDNESTAKM